MSFLLNLSTTERKVFARHFLSSVHLEIRYKPIEINRLLDKKSELEVEFKNLGFAETREMIRGDYQFEANKDQAPKLSQRSTLIGIIFSNQSPKCELKIETDKIVYSDLNYSSFEKYQSKFRDIYNKVSEILSFDESVAINKVGFRKVNSVVIQPFSSFQDGLSIFNPALFGTARSGLLKVEKFRINEETTVLEETNDKLFILRTKLIRSGEDSVDVTMDADFVKVGKDISINEALDEILPSLNQCHFDLFMWSVTDEMRHLMESE